MDISRIEKLRLRLLAEARSPLNDDSITRGWLRPGFPICRYGVDLIFSGWWFSTIKLPYGMITGLVPHYMAGAGFQHLDSRLGSATFRLVLDKNTMSFRWTLTVI